MSDKTKSFQEEMKELSLQLEAQSQDVKRAIAEDNAAIEEVEKKKQKTLFDVIIEKGDVTAEQVQAWKESFRNKIYVTQFDDEEYYIYRYLARPEVKVIESQLGANGSADLEDELIVNKCVLFPVMTPDVKALMGGGVIKTLSNQIRIVSGYLPDALAIELIQKL